MAFPSAAGYGNLPRGNFSPIIYSQKVLKFFKTVSVVEEISNTEYEGEISQFGDTVRIIMQPTITVSEYTRGKIIVPQDIDDQDTTLTIDQAFSYSFRIDDIEKRHSHVGWAEMAEESGAYKLRDQFDINVFAEMFSEATTTAGTGTSGSEVTIGFDVADNFTPLDLVNRLARLMDENNIPDDGGRFVVAKPQFYEWLGKEDSKYIEANTMGDGESFVRQRKLGSRPIGGFTMYKSNNVPNNANSKPRVLAGHVCATATAKNILISETLRASSTFADEYRALFVFGREVLRPEALFSANIDYS